MACEPNCGDCQEGVDVVDCARAAQLRCKVMAQIEAILCSPDGPIEIDGVRYEGKGVALKNLRETLDWTYTLCEKAMEQEGPMVLWTGSQPCDDRNCCG